MPKKLVDWATRRDLVLDDRRRTIGVDVEGLGRQVRENQERLKELDRRRRQEEAAWAMSWERVAEAAERKAEALRKRAVTYRMELWEQMEAKRRAKEDEEGAGMKAKVGEGGFYDGFGQSHR